jgi:phosphohistidine phosphatase
MKLYFLRHGEAGEPEEWQGDDALRPLTDEGRRRMTREARTLERLELGVDRVISSPLVRAVQTAEIVATALRRRNRLVEDRRLGAGFGPERLAEILLEYADARDLMLVGHEPSMSATIGRLTGATVELKKGGLARVDIRDRTQARGGTLDWLLPPRVLLLD